MQSKFVLAAALAAIVGVSGSAAAQRPFKFGVSGGVSVPVSDLSDDAKTGFVLNANIGTKPIGFPVTLQLEGGWNQWGVKNTGGADANVRVLSLTGNVVYDFPSAPKAPVRPYVMGLAGWYHLTGSASAGGVTVSSSTDKFGLGGGVGIRMPLSGFDTYLEARYSHALDTSVSFIPITFGIRF